MAALDDAADDFFRLPPLPSGEGAGFKLTPLVTVAPRFVLPSLDENAPGVERLLGTLGSTLVVPDAASLPPLPSLPTVQLAVHDAKGKGRAAPIDAELWRLAGIDEPGPSKPRAFHVSLAVQVLADDSPSRRGTTWGPTARSCLSGLRSSSSRYLPRELGLYRDS